MNYLHHIIMEATRLAHRFTLIHLKVAEKRAYQADEATVLWHYRVTGNRVPAVLSRYPLTRVPFVR